MLTYKKSMLMHVGMVSAGALTDISIMFRTNEKGSAKRRSTQKIFDLFILSQFIFEKMVIKPMAIALGIFIYAGFMPKIKP